MAEAPTRAPTRSWEEVRSQMLERARAHRNPFTYSHYVEVERAFTQLTSVDRDAWAAAFEALGQPYEERAREAEARGDAKAAEENYLLAYDYYHVGRYPAPNSPGKRRLYPKSQEMYLKAAQYFDPPLERVEMPFRGRPGEGSVAVGYLRKPNGVARRPVLVCWGGIDSFKEERRDTGFLEAGIASLTIDMPGVADAPLAGSDDAERLWDAIFDWIGTRADLDVHRVALLGGSTGGYWATKVAHTHRDRIRAAINQGGPAHYAFTPEWIAKAQLGEYPFELAETLACAFGRATYDDWVAYAPKLSLVTQGIVDQPCAPLLLVNGLYDSVFPIQDMYVLLEHGSPKDARLFPSGHMGHTPETRDIMVNWLLEKLR